MGRPFGAIGGLSTGREERLRHRNGTQLDLLCSLKTASLLEANVSAQMQIAALIYMMVQAVFFGIGIILVLGTPLQAEAMKLIPAVVVASSLVSAPVSWLLAPRLQARYWRAKGVNSDFISGPATPSPNP